MTFKQVLVFKFLILAGFVALYTRYLNDYLNDPFREIGYGLFCIVGWSFVCAYYLNNTIKFVRNHIQLKREKEDNESNN